MPSQKPVYCPICGHTLTEREEGGRLRPACDNCGYVHFVNPVPGVGMLIEMDGGVVLIKRRNPPNQGKWTLPSGFVEADESAEEAAVREAEEETGLKTEIIELAAINSFPEGPPVSGIMVFYRMRPIGGQLQAGDDATEARVFAPDELPLLPFRTHREMIAEWLENHVERSANMPIHKPASIHIRLTQSSDAEQVMGLLALIPANRHLTDEEWAAVRLRLQESPLVEVYVAETTDSPSLIVGCCALSVVRGLTEGGGLLNDMAVLPLYQRRGVGAELLEVVMRRAGELNLRTLWVNTHRANDQARAFYAKLGFRTGEMMRLKIR
ncbi:GNAT family N-acetyltransferase [Phototrophicus methaneseepsis]|uniref:GNAT family N-acetyltransferase n=1 Tax=Phototrophicus methaneseepsis TaxID=2710758 RepID=A0A7S8EDB7_9CHLR|nr:GNAT family N-acetyltransferase [Phototrophicus methaneseepsis]QPC84754.1 GNAT family N-acetyltransferase [Phototrophicus methaneseepsis]